MIPISVCIITKNEAENLEKCLAALAQHPFEIVVVDTGSSDASIKIAQKYTDRVYTYHWTGDFSAARNYAADLASHNTILSVDTDEFLADIDWEELQNLISQNEKNLGAITLNNFFREDNGETGCQVCQLNRIFNRKYYHFEKAVHEMLVPCANLAPSVYEAPIVMNHVGYLSSPEKLAEKSRRDMELLQAEIEAEPGNPYNYFQMGQSCMLMRDCSKALFWFRKAMELGPEPGADYTLVLLCNYASILLDHGLVDEAAGVLPFHGSYSDNRDFLCLAGKIYLHMGQPLKALPEFVQALNAPKYSLENSCIPHFYIGLIYEMFGKQDIARSHYESCGDSYPPAVEALKRLN